MEELLKEALSQGPLLTIVLGFLYLNNREWRKHLTARNAKTEEALGEMTKAITKSNNRLFKHLEKHEK